MNRVCLLVALLTAGTLAEAAKIKPFAKCIELDQNGDQTAVVFGYESLETQPVTFAAGGAKNFVLPGNFRPGLLSTFSPGLFDPAFRLAVLRNETTLLWILDQELVAVDFAKTAPCSANGVPELPPGAVSVTYSQKLAVVGNRVGVTWSASVPLPPGLNLAPDGTLSGTPSATGKFFVRVKAADGLATAPAVFSLQITGGLAVNEPLSIRPPGFTPQFRVVSNVAGTISTTASCNPDEFVITGGGVCTVPNSNTVLGRMATSEPAGNGWQVVCSGGTATAVAVCSLK